ncbi:MAG: putative lipid II flippase FtsW [Deltaproteobacteria bacterium]|nr:putative lipid II flippase FtsW [Deltaproteobacteria bacterium]
MSTARTHAGTVDWWLVSAVLVFAGFSLIMVMSASGIMAERVWGDKYHFFKRQAIFTVAGLAAFLAAIRIPMTFFYRMVYPGLILTAGLLAMTLVSPLKVEAGGASRWLNLGIMSLQPLEVAKIALIFYLAYFFSHKQDKVRTFSVGFLPPTIVTSGLCLLLLLQPDFGGAAYLGMLLLIMSLVGGTRLFYLFSSVAVAGTFAALLVVHSPYRFRRWFAFLDPFKDPLDSGYQLVQSLYGLGSGNWLGQGLGSGKQKLFFLPDAHNDFILAVVGEELGFVGVSLVFILIAIILWRSLAIAIGRTEMQDRLTAFGLGAIIVLGGILNTAVVLGAVPPKGIPMPFLSYGGSQLLTSFFCAGILVNLSRSKGTKA